MAKHAAPHFHDVDEARKYLERIRWPDGPICPKCGVIDHAYATKKPGVYRCAEAGCRKDFSVTVGTLFERSHISLHKWLFAAYLIAASKKGISSHQLSRMLDVTYKTAWFLSHRLREAMAADGGPIGGGGATVEIDETFLGKQPTVFKSGRGWQTKTGTGGMLKIVTLVERGGRARSIEVHNLQKAEIARALQEAARDSVLNTDQAQHYRRIGLEFDEHHSVDHGAGEYGRWEGGVSISTNTVEGFFSIFKRGMKGVYQHCAKRHLHRYLAEFDFRYSNRIAMGIGDTERADRILAGISGKRLMYRAAVAS